MNHNLFKLRTVELLWKSICLILSYLHAILTKLQHPDTNINGELLNYGARMQELYSEFELENFQIQKEIDDIYEADVRSGKK